MLRAAVFGVIASSGLVIGAIVGVRLRMPQLLLAMLLAFAAGSLMTALAFELFEESHRHGGGLAAAIGFGVGAGVFTGIGAWLNRKVEHRRRRRSGSAKGSGAGKGSGSARMGRVAGLALLAAVTLDGVPENTALGVTLGEGAGSLALLVAIFLSNLPESIVSAASLKESGWSALRVVALWSVTALLLAGAVIFGRAVLSDVGGAGVSIPLAFAAGAVVASLADTLMPEAYEKGGSAVALATAAGFLLSYQLSIA